MKKMLLGAGIAAAIIGAVVLTEPGVHVSAAIPENVIPAKVLEGSASKRDDSTYVVAFVPLGYSGTDAYAWAWMAQYTQPEDGSIKLQSATSTPVVITQDAKGMIMLQEPGDADYAKMVRELFPRKIRSLFDTGEEHNALVAQAEAKAQQLAVEYFAGVFVE